jgi:hypothetical protein
MPKFATNAVPRPAPAIYSNISPWVDEQIWGHRLWDGQTPWLLFLEFLCVAEAREREGLLLQNGEIDKPLTFKPYKRMFLRNILFNSEFLSKFDQGGRDSNTAWREWLDWMGNKAKGVPTTDFSYLKSRFRSFSDFAALVSTVRSSAVESQTNRRWTSRFVFPFGRNGLYEDLNIGPSGQGTREYINFGRTGELLYLMISRSSRAAELKPVLARLIGNQSQWDTLLKLLQPTDDDDCSPRTAGYLPYAQHPQFDLLAEDWESILRLELPGFDAFQHLVTLGALHVVLYQLSVASEVCDGGRKIHFVCESIAPRKTLIRELSASNFQENNVLSARAVEAYVAAVGESDAWRAAVEGGANEADSFARCRAVLEKEVWWGEDYDGTGTAEALLGELRDSVLRRHRRHVGNIHRVYGREVGLVSRRGTVKLRYAPTDALIKTLLLANVPRRVELGEFLAKLYERYGIIFGDREAEQALPRGSFDEKRFRENTQRLEHRLSSLGMLRRLSDACAYVENPHTRTTS